MTGMMGTTCGDHGDHRPWGPSGGYGNDMGTMGMMWDDGDNAGIM